MPATTTKRGPGAKAAKSGAAKPSTRVKTSCRSRSRARRVGAVHASLRASLSQRGATLIQGDSIKELAKLPECSVDCIVTDPPYGLTDGLDVTALLTAWLAGEEHKDGKKGFMDKEWDACVPSPALWREAMRVLKPGAHMLVFSSSRTQDLTGISLRIAGFEVRDILAWLYLQGMSFSKDIGQDLGYASKTAVGSKLKQSHESILVARRPVEKGQTFRANVATWGTGGLNIDSARIGTLQTKPGAVPGRIPANTLLSHSPECRRLGTLTISTSAHSPGVKMTGFGSFGGGTTEKVGESYRPGHEDVEDWECAPGCPVAALNGQRDGTPARCFAQLPADAPLERVISGEEPPFMLCPKPSKKEREAGLDESRFAPKRAHRLTYGKRAEVAIERLNVHQTVKPLALMRWLINLACPVGGTVLDPFMGSGSTGCAAAQCHRSFIGIELDDTEGYIDIAAARIDEHLRLAEGSGLTSPSAASD